MTTVTELAGLKPGDRVVIDHGIRDARVGRIDRMTATQFIVGNGRYRRRDGKSIGTSSWEHAWLRVGDPESFAAIEAKQLARRLADVRVAEWLDLGLERMRAVYGILYPVAKTD